MKRMGKIIIIVVINIIVIVGLCFIAYIWALNAKTMNVYSCYIENTIGILSLVIAAIGIIFVIAQMEEAKKLQESEFIVHLNQSFVDNAGYAEMYVELEKSKRKNKKPKISRIDISNYLTFFETMYILLENKAIKMGTLDDLFEYRFFIAVHNETVQKEKLVNEAYNFRNIYYLEKRWMQYRRKHGLSIYGEKNNLHDACMRAGKEQDYIDIMSNMERKKK